MKAIKKRVYLLIRSFRKKEIKYFDYLERMKSLKEDHGESIVNTLRRQVDEEIGIAQRRLDHYKKSLIKKYCNYHGYSDVHPFEVVRIISRRKIEIREMNAILEKAPVTFHAGGFSGHTENSEQVWRCESQPNYPTKTITFTKKGWGNGCFRMNDEPVNFYDYNF